jgi:hypothetical protein
VSDVTAQRRLLNELKPADGAAGKSKDRLDRPDQDLPAPIATCALDEPWIPVHDPTRCVRYAIAGRIALAALVLMVKSIAIVRWWVVIAKRS